MTRPNSDCVRLPRSRFTRLGCQTNTCLAPSKALGLACMSLHLEVYKMERGLSIDGIKRSEFRSVELAVTNPIFDVRLR